MEDTPTFTDTLFDGTTIHNTTLFIGKGGKDDGTPDGWDGLVDDVRIYDYVLTPAQIAEVARVPTASKPNPADGSEIDGLVFPSPPNIYTLLNFTPGVGAVSHEAFFSDDEAKVTARDPTVSLGEPGAPPTTYYVGLPLSDYTPYTESLVRGTWYYWCVDETDDQARVWPGAIWRFYVRSDKASDPSPPDDWINVNLTPTLSWAGGVGVEEHDVYFGYTFDDVNDADMLFEDPEFRDTQLKEDVDWDPNADGGLTLDYLTDYYWRIDEVHGSRFLPVIPGIVIKGDVWTFRTIPYIPIDDPNLIAWWSLDEGEGDRALDWSGHDNHGTVSGGPEWVAGMIGNALDFNGSNQYVAITGFAEIQDLNEVTFCMWVKADVITGNHKMWFTNETGGNGRIRCRVNNGNWSFQYGQGASGNNVDVTSPATAGVWTHFAGVRVNDDRLELFIDGVSVATQPFLVAGPAMNQSSIGGEWRGGTDLRHMFDGIIDEVRIYDFALTESEIRRAAAPPEAWSPDPPDGINLVDPTEFVECTWKAGGDAAQHRVYWGTAPGSLTLVATKPLAEPNYDPGPLAFETSYYWRIDEVNGIDVVTGDEWTFSTVREAGMGSILVERWLNITGTDLDILKNDPRFPDNPDEGYEVPRFHSGTGLGDDYGGRIHGWLIPDTTGDYRFWLACDDPGELWLSDSADPFAAELIAYIPTDNYSAQYQWFKHTTQDSNNVAGGLIHLEADQRYYICALWKEAGGGDHGVVAWQGPDQPDPPVSGSGDAVIDGYYLMPFTRLWASNPKPRHRQEISAEDFTLLTWTPGIYAVTHDVYFGTSLSDVNESATPVSATRPLDANYYDPTIALGGPIEWETTYYWRIDEVNGTDVWTGGIWWFRTTNYALLEDFESYQYAGSSDDPIGERYVWKDGWSFFPVVKSGSNLMLGGIDEPPRPYLHYDGYNPHPREEQGMVFYYDNDGNTSVPGWPGYIYPTPKYSEVEAATTGLNGLGVGRDWLRQDLKALSLWFRGHPTRNGSFSYSGFGLGPYTATMESDGTDIWNVGPNPYHDEFHYAYQYLVGSSGYIGCANVIARVESVEDTDGWAKAGVMMRESLAVDANHATVVVTPGSGVAFQYRDVKRGASTTATQGGITAPHWVRLRRDNWGMFYAYHANDAEHLLGTWNPVVDTASSQVSIYMDPNIYVGLALTSHDAAQMCTAQFSGVEFQPDTYLGSSVIGPWQSRDIGIISNDPEPMYLALQDTGFNVGIKYHEDPNAALIDTWTEWNIDLADANFAALDMHNIDRVYIGLGDRVNKPGGGKGVMYIDDIRIYRSRFIPGKFPPMLDGNIHRDAAGLADGLVDEKDLNVMAGEWLKYDYFVPTSDPGTANLIARYLFEGNCLDSVVPYYPGAPQGTPTYSTDSMEGTYAIEFTTDTNDYVDCGNPSGLNFGTGNWSVCAWVKTTMSGTGDANKGSIVGKGGDNTDGIRYALGVSEATEGKVTITTDDNVDKKQATSSTSVNDGEWHHVVGLRDVNDLRVYVDGILEDTEDTLPAEYDLSGTSQHNAYIGTITDNRDSSLYKFLIGSVDDVRIYTYALSDAEIAYLADTTPLDGQLYVPLVSIANIYDEEAEGLKWVNFRDFAVLANDWLKEEQYWPAW